MRTQKGVSATHFPGKSACQHRHGSCSILGRRPTMLFTIAVILLVLWLLGLVSGYTMGNFIYVLLVIALVLFVVGPGQRPTSRLASGFSGRPAGIPPGAKLSGSTHGNRPIFGPAANGLASEFARYDGRGRVEIIRSSDRSATCRGKVRLLHRLSDSLPAQTAGSRAEVTHVQFRTPPVWNAFRARSALGHRTSRPCCLLTAAAPSHPSFFIAHLTLRKSRAQP